MKQERILQSKRPPILIGTPGRLWAMVRQLLFFKLPLRVQEDNIAVGVISLILQGTKHLYIFARQSETTKCRSNRLFVLLAKISHFRRSFP